MTKARRKYAPSTPEGTLEEVVYEALRSEKARKNRLANVRRMRLNYRKWWVSAAAYERLQEIKARIAREADPKEWGGLNRIEQNTHALTLLLDDFEQADEKRHVPIGAHVSRPDTCPVCLAQVGEVWAEGEPVRDERGPHGQRVVALNGTPQFEKAARDLAAWRPEYGFPKIMKAYKENGGPANTLPPFFSESFLYELLGKDEARTLRAYLRDLLRAGGIPDERTYEIL